MTNLNKTFSSNLKISRILSKSKRDLILSILRSTTTKREAKNYLKKYRSHFDTVNNLDQKFKADLSLSKIFRKDDIVETFLHGGDPFSASHNGVCSTSYEPHNKLPLRLAIFRIDVCDLLPDTYEGISKTFRRLVQLGISPLVILAEGSTGGDFRQQSMSLNQHAQKLLQILARSNEHMIDKVEVTILYNAFETQNSKVQGVSLPRILMPLYQGMIPILLPQATEVETSKCSVISLSEAIVRLCSSLLGKQEILSIEKVVIIDSIGGIPSIERNQSSHVFINLSQEYSDIVSELFIGHLEPTSRTEHISNLNLMNDVLNLIHAKTKSNDATGVISTPLVLSISDDQMNPLIYNVLTDRPVISSSLPSSFDRTPKVSTSILKKGHIVQVVDEHSVDGNFTFKDLCLLNVISEEKLRLLIEDSFGRELHWKEYVSRINSNLATVVIIGDYEGAAIVTWEHLDDGEKIAYLDKFAIAKKNQGLPSLADIIFKLVTQCHQGELVWRSRAENPVNKWYFERCRGFLLSPSRFWKLFYIGEVFDERSGRKIDGSERSNVNFSKRLEMYADLVERIDSSFK